MSDDTLERVASKLNTHEDFDGVLARYTARLIEGEVKERRVLECGCSTGVITEMLVESAAALDVVEGSERYAKLVQERFPGKLKMHVSRFENFDPPQKFDRVLLLAVLHHLEDPAAVLQTAAKWIAPGGSLLLTVPNMTSLHRRLGVASGKADAVDATSERNVFFEQPGRFTQKLLEEMVTTNGYNIVESSTFFLKPFPHEIMNSLELDQSVLDGLFQLGKELPELACQLYIEAEPTIA